MNQEIICPSCHLSFNLNAKKINLVAHYCPYCRGSLQQLATTIAAVSHDNNKETAEMSTAPSISFLTEHIPAAGHVQFSIGPYQVLHSIGKGGMGEVFLAYDTTCGRRIALKQIRPDLMGHKQLHNRFLKEARITSQLTHPAIIPIYAIHSEADLTYYTMPYVEGQTLKQLLQRARQHEKSEKKVDNVSESIPALVRIFLSICQAVAYSHSKHVLHRDLKPENIIVGQYGQIVILDWGLAKLLKSIEKNEEDLGGEQEAENPLHHLTHLGKVVGTLAYMAPERALGHPANFQTDIYSLGVILYQLLTLKHPFRRESLKQFRKQMHQEKLIDPAEVAPYRDVPRSLSRVVLKSLSLNIEQRYKSVDDIIHDIENYIEGRSEWFQTAELKIENKKDWEFQENVLIPEHVALVREMEASDWVSLMISKDSFQENIKIEADIKIGDKGHGIGFLLSIPEAAERTHLNDGYCLWLGSELSKSTKLLRSTVEVMHSPDVFLKHNEWYHVCIEKVGNNIHFYLNQVLQFSYISHLPLAGTHVGLLSRDADFELKNFYIYIRSQNITVNCLAVPDAFLAHKDYTIALNEYRRIGYSFPGRAEGREAMFRAGITLLEQANNTEDRDKKTLLYDLAQEEFHRLYNTPGAPLEYLGKALVYQSLGDYQEEAKCFELAYRRYPQHPLLPILQEQIIYRMYDSSRYHRQATFNFILLTLRYITDATENSNTKKLLRNLEKHWEPLYFVENETNDPHSEKIQNLTFVLKLAFWLGRPYVLGEIIDELLTIEEPHLITIGNAFFCLLELGAWKIAQQKLDDVIQHFFANEPEQLEEIKESTELGVLVECESLEAGVKAFDKMIAKKHFQHLERILIFLMEQALDQGKPEIVHDLSRKISMTILPEHFKEKINHKVIWAYLLQSDWKKAGELFHQYPLEVLNQETSLLHFLYGCWLYVTEGKEISTIHFMGLFEVPYPRTWNIFSYFLKGKIIDNEEWKLKSFLWERKQLYRQLTLFYHCTGETKKSLFFQEKTLVQKLDE